MSRWLYLFFPAVLLVWSGVIQADSDSRNLRVGSNSAKRVALVIGNNGYRHVPRLEKAVNDAKAVGAALKRVGYATTVRTDIGQRDLNREINRFIDDVAGGGEGVLYFAGHGIQINNQNFLIPVDFEDPRREADVADQSVSLQVVQDKLAEAHARYALIIIDACRNNPLPKKAGRALGGTRGLAQASSAEGQMVVFSAGANQQALDKLHDEDSHPNGVFTREFLPWIEKPGVKVRDAILQVRRAVHDRAKGVNHDQFPAVYDQVLGDFYFKPGDGTQIALPTMAATISRTPQQIEDALWDTIRDSNNLAVFEEYLIQYPNGRYVPQARILIAKAKDELRNQAGTASGSHASDAARYAEGAEEAVWASVEKGNHVDDYDAYLKQFPQGKFAVLAKSRKTRLEQESQSASQSSRVLGQWGDGLWYPATITGKVGSQTSVAFDDGDKATLSASRIRPIDWAVGTKVQCNWLGRGRYYSGTITAMSSSAAVHINYDDGDQEDTTIGRCRSR